MIENKEKLFIALPFFIIIVSLGIGTALYFKPPEPALSPVEKKVLNYAPVHIDIKEKTIISVTDDIASPFENARKDFPAISLSALTSQASQIGEEAEKLSELRLTLIVLNRNKSNMAIINGLVLKEGDIISNMKIEKIEKNRILLKHILAANQTRWVYLEEK